MCPPARLRLPIKRILRRGARRRHADLGADLDQRGWPRPVRRRAGDRDLGFRRARQAVRRRSSNSPTARQPEGVRAAGGRRLAEVRFGLLPQVLPVIAGQVLYYIEFEHPLRDHHRRGRRGRHRAVSLRADPRAGMAAGFLPDSADSDRGRRDRLRLAAACAPPWPVVNPRRVERHIVDAPGRARPARSASRVRGGGRGAVGDRAYKSADAKLSSSGFRGVR